MDFEQIYKEYSSKIFRVCMGYMNDHEHARDMVQETFIAVWQGLPSFRNEAKISTWIFRIATNICLRAIEKENRVKKAEFPINLPAPMEEHSAQELQFLYTCISGLEEVDRIIISLVLEDLPQADIAAIVGLSEGNTRVKIHRIKEKLSNKFKQHGQL